MTKMVEAETHFVGGLVRFEQELMQMMQYLLATDRVDGPVQVWKSMNGHVDTVRQQETRMSYRAERKIDQNENRLNRLP